MNFIERVEKSNDGWLIRTLTLGSRSFSSRMVHPTPAGSARDAWDYGILSGLRPTADVPPTHKLRLADLFCGAGGLSLGIEMACKAVGVEPVFTLAADQEADAMDVYCRNFDPRRVVTKNVASLLDYHVEGKGPKARFSYEPEVIDFDIARLHQGIDLLVAGPPCQGHSNLNNYTRRSDPRNNLYLTVPAFAVAMGVPRVVIENVPEVSNDDSGVLATAVGLLEADGYNTVVIKLRATKLGVAQTRTRLFLLASKGSLDHAEQVVDGLSRSERPLSWAIGDLVDSDGPTLFDRPSILDATNSTRVDYLFDNDEYDLPNAQRPDCHKDGHTYKSIYGRMFWDKPSMTITQGFSVAGRGRFIHPLRRRTLTPHEAARIQGFPDTFRFETRLGDELYRSALTKMIGNAVPPAFGQVCGLIMLVDAMTSGSAPLATASSIRKT